MTRICDSGWSLTAIGPSVTGTEWRAEHESGAVPALTFSAPKEASRLEVLAALDREARSRDDARRYRALLRASWAEQDCDERPGAEVRRAKEW